MPKYDQNNFNEFMLRINTANTKFTLKRSSLKNLIAVLAADSCTSSKALVEIRKINHAKKIKYWNALLYLRMTMKSMPHIALPGGGASLGKSNAVMLNKVELPAIYKRSYAGEKQKDLYSGPDKFAMLKPQTHFLGKTVEHYIWEYKGKLGIILIHLGKVVSGMDMMMEGKTCTAHINSVLEVAAQKNIKLCALHLNKDLYVNANLLKSYQKIVDRTTVFEPDKHEGGDIDAFKNFADEHDVCIVMGWDADVCVAANVLGSSILDKSNDKIITPILGRTNVVTSRSLIITTGNIHTEQWGVLWGA